MNKIEKENQKRNQEHIIAMFGFREEEMPLNKYSKKELIGIIEKERKENALTEKLLSETRTSMIHFYNIHHKYWGLIKKNMRLGRKLTEKTITIENL